MKERYINLVAVIGDLLAFLSAGLLASVCIKKSPVFINFFWNLDYSVIAVVGTGLLYSVFLYLFKTYELSYLNTTKVYINRISTAVLFQTIAIFILFYTSDIYYYSRYFPLYLGLFLYLFTTTWRIGLKKYFILKLIKLKMLSCRSVIIGEGRAAKEIKKILDKQNHAIEMVGLISDVEKDFTWPVLGSFTELEQVIEKHRIDTIFFAKPHLDDDKAFVIINKILSLNCKVYIMHQRFQSKHLKLFTDTHGDDFFKIILFKKGGMHFYEKYFKRMFDLILTSLITVIISPGLLSIYFFIKKNKDGPALFFQDRLGYGEKYFKIIKFRTMKTSAETDFKKISLLNQHQEQLFKMKNDPRVTKGGAILRKFSLDELPQLFNIIKGDMSLVGPRPLVLDKEKLGKIERIRFAACSGISGIWQTCGRNSIEYDEMVIIDAFYRYNISFRLDIYLLIKTVKPVFFGQGF